jgi:hypothetical protein
MRVVVRSLVIAAAIQADLDAIATQQVPVGSQFDSNRYSVFFEPGTYGSAADPLVFQVGYYSQVAGLARSRPRRSSTAPSTCSTTSRAAGLRAAGARSVRRRLRQQRGDLGGVAGRADPPGHHQRQRRVPGLLRDQQLRQRRLHRRQPGQR